jgi:hypothetical protein
MAQYMMGWKDVFISPLILGLIYLFAYLMQPRLTNSVTKKYFFPALHVKMLGVFFFAFIYQFYYGGGDTFSYSQASFIINKAFWENPLTAFKILFTGLKEYDSDVYHYVSRIWMYRGKEEWMTSRIVGFVGLFTFSSYLASSLIIGFFAFMGTWKIFQVFVYHYPKYVKLFNIGILYIPSCIFWASGMLKDTICLGAIGFFFYYSTSILHYKNYSFRAFFYFIVSFLIIYLIKSYIILAFLPGLILWKVIKIYQSISSKIFKLLISFSTTLALIFLFISLFFVLGDELKEAKAFQEIQYKVEGFQRDHGRRTKGSMGIGEASTYHLDVDISSPVGMFIALPLAINVTLFRPYPWEVGKIVTLLGSFESFLFLILTVYIFFVRNSIIKIFQKILGNSELVLCIGFVVLLSFVIGLTAFNFGVLTRFKTPLMPFYSAFLIILYAKK